MEMILALGLPNWVHNLGEWWFTGIMGICLYFVPVVTCLIVYTIKGAKIYFRLRKERVGVRTRESKNRWNRFFNPEELTLGHIIGFTFISVCPLINLIAFFKETAWEVLKFICKKFEWVFTTQLVPDKEKYKKIREDKVQEEVAREGKKAQERK